MATATLEKTADPRITSAIGHRGPRFVTNGVALTDFEEVTRSIASWDDWCSAWSKRAAVHEAMGREALANRKFLSAGEHLQRAGVYYHFGKFLFVQDLAQMKAAHMKAVECRQAALPHLRPPGERVQIPYEGKMLAGILRKPPGYDKPPVVVMAVGLDSTRRRPTPMRRRSWRAGSRRSSSRAPAKARRNTILPSAATMRCRPRQ